MADFLADVYKLLATLGSICFVTSLLQPRSSSTPKAGASSEAGAGFGTFRREYLLVYAVITLADWLQGTHFHALYAEHGLTNEQTGSLFLTGFLASAVIGTYVGALVDSVGRRRGCAVYCILEVIINALEHSTDFRVLWVGRILGGISTSLLGCAFESWMVTKHKQSGYSPQALERTFTITSFMNGLLAVAAGILAHVLGVCTRRAAPPALYRTRATPHPASVPTRFCVHARARAMGRFVTAAGSHWPVPRSHRPLRPRARPGAALGRELWGPRPGRLGRSCRRRGGGGGERRERWGGAYAGPRPAADGCRSAPLDARRRPGRLRGRHVLVGLRLGAHACTPPACSRGSPSGCACMHAPRMFSWVSVWVRMHARPRHERSPRHTQRGRFEMALVCGNRVRPAPSDPM